MFFACSAVIALPQQTEIEPGENSFLWLGQEEIIFVLTPRWFELGVSMDVPEEYNAELKVKRVLVYWS